MLVALRRIIRATEIHSRDLLRRFGITGPQLLVLLEVAKREELPCTALAEALSVSLPTATEIVARLDARGLVERRQDPSDKRQVLVTLTRAGDVLLEAAPPPLQESFTRQLSALHDWERTQMLAVLQRIVAMMEADELDASPMLATGELAATPEPATDRDAKGP